MTNKIGFACKLSELHPTKGIVSIPEYNVESTTVTWLNKQTQDVAEEKLWYLITHNLVHIYNLVEKVGSLDEPLRMVRLGSDILPVYTHANYKEFYTRLDVVRYLEKEFSKIGDLARNNMVRLSFHPGQFTVLASENPDIVDRSIEEFEYHADMARYMGYGKTFQDLKINVHISGRQGPAGIKRAYTRLSPEARNCITIENEEYTWGLDECLTLGDTLPIVLDIHHHNINTGEYIEATDGRIQKIIDSWRGVRPVIHYSASREDLLTDHSRSQRPSLSALMEQGYKKNKLRAHSDFMWNDALNDWAYSHWAWADVMVECKSKNLGVQRLFDYWKQFK